MKIPAYVLELARKDAPLMDTLAGHRKLNEQAHGTAQTRVDAGDLESFDRDAYVVAIKAIVCGLAA